MKQRFISAVVAIIILFVILLLHNTIVLNLFIVAISLIATYELLNATGLIKHSILGSIPIGFSLILPFAMSDYLSPYVPALIFLVTVCFFLIVIAYHSEIQFHDMAMALVFSLMVPLFFSTAVYMRDTHGTTLGIYYFILALGSAWFCDTCAFFAGYFFGKHKMAPTISPKKTIEGGVGGVIGAVILNLLMSFLLSLLYAKLGTPIQVNYAVVALISPFMALLGMLGDLIASVIKRQYGVKDYGHIMPGHGGIMDRFDSALLTIPAVYIISGIVNIAV